MVENVNDIGEFISPQTSHVLFSEFLKFMFLNYINIKNSESSKTKESKKSKSDSTKDHSYIGLVAPPYIDLVWRSLCKLKSYYFFCKLIFNGFLEIPDIHYCSQDCVCDYNLTLKLLNQYRDILLPFNNLWPDYEGRLLLEDYQSNYWVSYFNLDNIKKEISNWIEETKSATISNAKSICENIKSKIIKQNEIKSKNEKFSILFKYTIKPFLELIKKLKCNIMLYEYRKR